MIFERCFESTGTTETDGEQERCASGTDSGHCMGPRGRRCEEFRTQHRPQRPVIDGTGKGNRRLTMGEGCGQGTLHGGGRTRVTGNTPWRGHKGPSMNGPEKGLSLIHISEPTRPKR